MSFGDCTVRYQGSPCAGSAAHKRNGLKPVLFVSAEPFRFADGDTLYLWNTNNSRDVTRKVTFWYCQECHIDIMQAKLLHDLKGGKLE